MKRCQKPTSPIIASIGAPPTKFRPRLAARGPGCEGQPSAFRPLVSPGGRRPPWLSGGASVSTNQGNGWTRPRRRGRMWGGGKGEAVSLLPLPRAAGRRVRVPPAAGPAKLLRSGRVGRYRRLLLGPSAGALLAGCLGLYLSSLLLPSARADEVSAGRLGRGAALLLLGYGGLSALGLVATAPSAGFIITSASGSCSTWCGTGKTPPPAVSSSRKRHESGP
jgi:hypothetical protein